MTITNRKYLLKPNRILQTTFGGDTLTNDNLTDDAAEKLLEAHPALIKHFERYPSEEIVAEKTAAVAGEEQEPSTPIKKQGKVPVE